MILAGENEWSGEDLEALQRVENVLMATKVISAGISVGATLST
jgi:hypothetical protein